MPRLLADEDFARPVIIKLRALGHNVVTVAELGKANQEWPDEEVFKEAIAQSRIVLTKNRRDYYKLHCSLSTHYGVVACTDDTEFDRAAENIHNAIDGKDLQGRFIRVYKGS